MTRSIQGSEVFLKEDVRSILQAILTTNEMLARQLPDDVRVYRAGFTAAIHAVAVAFDIRLVNRTARDDYWGTDITGGA